MANVYNRLPFSQKLLVLALIIAILLALFLCIPKSIHQWSSPDIMVCNLIDSRHSPPPNTAPSNSTIKYRVGVFTIGLGKPYLKLAIEMIVMSELYLCVGRDHVRVEYFVFTNHNITDIYNESAPYGLNVSRIHIIRKEKKGWPLDSDRRYEFMADTIEQWEKKLNASNSMPFTNYVWIDTDNLFVADVCEELLSNLVGLSHAGVQPLRYPYETRKESAAYTDPYFQQYLPYFSAHIFAGKSKHFKQLVNELAANTVRDRSRGIQAKVDDESHLNSYFTRHVPTSILSRAFIYPETLYKGIEIGEGILNRSIYDNIYAIAKTMILKPRDQD